MIKMCSFAQRYSVPYVGVLCRWRGPFNRNTKLGFIPSELGLLSNSITGLFLHENYFEGTIPTGMFLNGTIVARVEQLRLLFTDDLQSPIFPELGLLTKLKSIWLHVTSLTGSVPIEVCNLIQAGVLKTVAIDCQKVSCTCGCSCPADGGDAPTDNTVARAAPSASANHTYPEFVDPPKASVSDFHTNSSSPRGNIFNANIIVP